MEQDQKDRDQEQGEAWGKAVAVAGEVVLRQGRVDIVSVPTVVKKQPINWGLRAMSKNVQNAERL